MDFDTAFAAIIGSMEFWTVLIALIIIVITYGIYKIIKTARDEGKPLDYKKDIKMTGKTVLITGANCGLGKATALDLAARGARVILACRSKEKAEEAAEEIKLKTGNQDVSIIILDLSDLESVKIAAENVIRTYGRLDVLINNAGVGLTDHKSTTQGFDMIFGTNHLGHFLFTQLLLNLLKKSAPSRIINVSSIALIAVRKKLNYDPTSGNIEVKYPNLQGYPISKLANYFHVKTLVDELEGSGVTANAVHPGAVKTEIMKRNVQDRSKAFLNKCFLLLSQLIGRTARDGCQTTVYVAVDPELEEVTGEYFSNMTKTTDKLPVLAKDKEEAEKLSKFSYEQCQDYLPLIVQDLTNEKKENDINEAGEEGMKQENILEQTETALITNAVEEIGTISESTFAGNFDDKMDDEHEEIKEEILSEPIETILETNVVETI